MRKIILNALAGGSMHLKRYLKSRLYLNITIISTPQACLTYSLKLSEFWFFICSYLIHLQITPNRNLEIVNMLKSEEESIKQILM